MQAVRLMPLWRPVFPVSWTKPGGSHNAMTLLRHYRIELGYAMRKVPTAEIEKYQKRYGLVGLTREDVIMLEILEAKREQQGWEQGLAAGRIATIESMLERGATWETVEEFTGIDEDGMNKLREELAALHRG